jgi:hypothetical protein
MQSQQQMELHENERGTRLVGAMNPSRDDWKPVVRISKTAAPGRQAALSARRQAAPVVA